MIFFENEQSLRDVYNKFLAHQEVHLEVLGYSDRLQTSSFQNYLPVRSKVHDILVAAEHAFSSTNDTD